MASNPAVDETKARDPLAANDAVVRAVRVESVLRAGSESGPPWPTLPSLEEVPWDAFMRFPSLLEAEITAGRLYAEKVPVAILWVPGLPDPFAELRIPRPLIHRARWVLSWAPPSDEELLFLATGEIGPVR